MIALKALSLLSLLSITVLYISHFPVSKWFTDNTQRWQ